MLSTSPFKLPRKTPLGMGENVAEWATGLNQLDRFYRQRPAGCTTKEFLRFTLEILGINYRVINGSLNTIPQTGATVVVANHPLGCVEGVILAELLLQVRSDVQILANHYLKTVPELDKLFIGVDVFTKNKEAAVKTNLSSMRTAHQHLEKQGLLLIFPAGEVSHLIDRKLQDKAWNESISRLIRKHRATALPVFIDGQNSARFYLAGKIHPWLRTLMLGRELLNKHNQQIDISIGQAIKYKEMSALNDPQLIGYLRFNTYLLEAVSPQSSRNKTDVDESLQPIAPPLSMSTLQSDIDALPLERHLVHYNEFDVFYANAEDIPNILHEIGRIREINFRKVGEGTGRALDIDKFDQEYLHLFIWDNHQQKIVGAYRLGLVESLIRSHGLNGLYSSTLFQYKPKFIKHMGKSIEMGRSVIAEAYQKSTASLLLLWKGIGAFISRHPEYTHLFGPVSISNDYSDNARLLLAQSLSLNYYDQTQAKLVEASHPLPNHLNQNWSPCALSAFADLQLLSKVIQRMDDGKSLPVLVRQYLGLNGKFVSFNVDPDFNNSLDGLIVVDLRQVEKKTLARYMGAEEAMRYIQFHQH